MGGAVLMKVTGCVVLGLLMLWRSCMICKAIGRGPPNLAHYEGHFSAIIPDLTLFVGEQREKHDKNGVSGTRGNRVAKDSKMVASRREPQHGHKKAREGVYVLDLLSHWDTQAEVWSRGVDEIDVVLQPGQAWTQELNQYKMKGVELMASLGYQTTQRPCVRKFVIRTEPFAGLARPFKNRGLMALLKQLPCHFFRLSRWVFDRELGALAVIYVQVAKGNMNMLARLALIHAPTSVLDSQPIKVLLRRHFKLWIYQSPTNSRPMPLDKIDVQKLVGALKSLALNNTFRGNQTFSKAVSLNGHLLSPKQDHPYMLRSKYKDCNSYNQSSLERNNIKYEVAHATHHEPYEIEAATVLASLKNDHHRKTTQFPHT